MGEKDACIQTKTLFLCIYIKNVCFAAKGHNLCIFMLLVPSSSSLPFSSSSDVKKMVLHDTENVMKCFIIIICLEKFNNSNARLKVIYIFKANRRVRASNTEKIE